MKFSVSSSALLSLLATTGKVISNKNTLPILDYFLMELKGDELRVTTSDLETTLVTYECKHRRGQVDIDAVHHGTQLVVGRGEDRLVDPVHHHVHIERQLLAGLTENKLH